VSSTVGKRKESALGHLVPGIERGGGHKKSGRVIMLFALVQERGGGPGLTRLLWRVGEKDSHGAADILKEF